MPSSYSLPMSRLLGMVGEKLDLVAIGCLRDELIKLTIDVDSN